MNQVTERVAEFQRYVNGTWTSALPEGDGAPWLDMNSGEARTLEQVALPAAWSWTSNWKCERDGEADTEGWVIREQFPPLYPKGRAKIRRRVWFRTREPASKVKTDTAVDQTGKDGKPLSEERQHLLKQYDSCKAEIVGSLQSLSSFTSKIESMTNLIGTSRDSAVIRSALKAHLSQGKQQCVALKKRLQELEQLEKKVIAQKLRSGSAMMKATRNKLVKDMNREQTRFLQACKVGQTKDRQIPVSKSHGKQSGVHAGTGSESWSFPASATEQASMEQEQRDELMEAEDVVVQSEIEINTEIMREREAAMKDITKDLHQVKEIFRDLADMVDKQQDGIDEVEKHATEAHQKTEEGLSQLYVADKSQQKGGCTIS